MRPPTSVSGATGGAQGIKVRTPSDKVSRATTLHTPPDGMQRLTRLRTPYDRVSRSTMLHTPSDRVSRLTLLRDHCSLPCTMGSMDTSMIAPHSACEVGKESSPGCNPNFRR